MIKVGGVFEMPLSNGKRAYGQYVFRDKKMGPLIQVFNLITEEQVDVSRLVNAGPLFPPIFTGLFAAINKGLWKPIGRMPDEKFVYPNFVNSHYDEKTGRAYMWFLWDGNRFLKIGPELPDKFKKLEYLVIWNPSNVIHRIESGTYPYPFGDLIHNNFFDPRSTEHK